MKYKLLGQTGLKVSELCLGTMGFGTEFGWGIDEKPSHEIMDRFAEAGGNFLDTANFYTAGTSERIIGNWLKQQDRDAHIIATKYTLHDNTNHPNASGNSRKNMIRSVEESLKRLQIDHIDLFYLHIWDHTTPMDEVMRGMDDLIRQGKIIYPAISDTVAWRVSAANTAAQYRNQVPFAALQVEYSLIQRTPERELIPMAKHFGMTVTPWAPLAGGALTGKYLRGDKGRLPETSNRLNEHSQSIIKEVVAIADEIGTSAGNVALQWTRQQGFESIPIVGATKMSQLEENLKVVDLVLEPAHMERLNQVSAIEMGFPHQFFQEEQVKKVTTGGFFDRLDRRRT
jgi:aryl-alcohol dehydrogenase-like predicted oxidoreductase